MLSYQNKNVVSKPNSSVFIFKRFLLNQMNGCTTCLGICDPDANLCIIYINVNISYHIDRAIWCVYTKKTLSTGQFLWKYDNNNNNNNNNPMKTKTTRMYTFGCHVITHTCMIPKNVYSICATAIFFYLKSHAFLSFFLSASSFKVMIQKKMLLFDVTMWINVFCLRCCVSFNRKFECSIFTGKFL